MTTEQIKTIHANYRNKSYAKIAKMLGFKCDWKVAQYCKKHGLKMDEKVLSEADKTFIRNNYQTMKELDICKVIGHPRYMLQLFKREEGLTRYAVNGRAKDDIQEGLFFNVGNRTCWIA